MPTTVEARRCREDVVIQTREGPLQARAGDWVVDDVDGNPYPVADNVFRRTYEPLGDDS